MSTAPSGYQNPKTNWAAGDVPTASDFNRSEGNVTAIETGSRTLDPAQAPSGNVGSLRQLLDWLANRLKAITGGANWHDAPATTLAAAKSHIDASAPHSGHETPAGAQAKVDAHAGQAAPHSGHATTAALTSHAGAAAPHSGHETPSGAQAKVGAHADSSTAHGIDRVKADLERNFYDDYLRQLELYYTGHFSGPEIAGQLGMTFDGFQDTNRVNMGVTDAVVNTSAKKVTCKTAASEWVPVSVSDGAGSSGLQKDHDFKNVANMCDNNLDTLASTGYPSGTWYFTVICDLGQTRNVDRIAIYGSGKCSISRLAHSNNLTNWTIQGFSTIRLDSHEWYERALTPFAARYIAVEFAATGPNPSVVGELHFKFNGYLTSVLQSTAKGLASTANRVRLYASHRIPVGNVSYQVSADGGSHWEAPTQISSRADPLDATYTEYTFERALQYPGSSLILRVTLTTDTFGSGTPEIKRYGLHWS